MFCSYGEERGGFIRGNIVEIVTRGRDGRSVGSRGRVRGGRFYSLFFCSF